MNRNDIHLEMIIEKYVFLEKEIQKRTNRVSGPFCRQCSSKCCKEEMCRESIKSGFLNLVTKKQHIAYDSINGWIGDRGCKLCAGRPLVCYEFFCQKILDSKRFRTSNIQRLIKDFILIGDRAYGSVHLVCINDLRKISKEKLIKINLRIDRLQSKLGLH